MNTLNPRHQSDYRWIMITLAVATVIFVLAIPTISLSVLFAEISTDLDMSLVQVGLVWGISSFTGMFIGLAGGILGDRFGTRRLLTIACIGVGILGAGRGIATDFTSFIVISFFMGLFAPLIGVNLHNVAGQWFSPKQLGLANGILSSGFAAGFLLGSLLAASTFSPLVGGWRPLMFVYGGVALILALAWWVLHPADPGKNETASSHNSFREGLPKVLRIRTVWLIGVGKIGLWGCVRGFTGYLPLYLRGIGWNPTAADQALAAFFIVSLLGAIPIPALSDRLGVRKPFLIGAALMMGLGSIMTGFVTGGLIFLAAMMAGVMFDAFMGLSITAVSEIKELGGALTGTAVGVIFFLSDIGGTIAPPLGNALAQISPELPFFLWGGMVILGSAAFYAIKEPTPR
ncbi:MAG: MFS family permease [Cellvibrionaceae bacterium]|jgi:MFS family permease